VLFATRTKLAWFTVVTTLRTFRLEAADLATATETASHIIISCIETVVEVKP
jgi:hypothetical protein